MTALVGVAACALFAAPSLRGCCLSLTALTRLELLEARRRVDAAIE
jgi:hypothetical protein